uniref:Uncharacterized protein n=1 Tax=Tetranychus urticae TaxID=32264 RepID=T1K0D8_TETUR
MTFKLFRTLKKRIMFGGEKVGEKRDENEGKESDGQKKSIYLY